MNRERSLRVALLFGGESAEHEVSLRSARNVARALDPAKYQLVLVHIDRRGRWYLIDDERRLLEADDPVRLRLEEAGRPLRLVPGAGPDCLAPTPESPALGPIDVAFPVLHGPLGEDGTVQGLLRLAHLPFVGAGVLGSAVAMDKELAKRLLREEGLPVAEFVALRRGDGAAPTYAELVERLGEPLFVKPANLGSSIGVHRVEGPVALEAALADAFSYDRKVLVEACVEGRELECSVLGNADPIASLPGEVVPHHEFYSYEAKYLDEDGAGLVVPARLPEETTRRVRELAVEAFRALACEGMARVDFFLRAEGSLVVNEVNTIPGFTRISMYPKLWEATGVAPTELVDRLVALALERDREERDLRTGYGGAVARERA